MKLHPVSSLGLGWFDAPSLQGGPDEQRGEELHLGAALLLRCAERRTWQLEIPLALLLLSTLVWRIRDVSELASQPLDAAGLARIGLLACAVAVALVSLPLRPTLQRIKGPTLLYLAFAAVAACGALLATAPALVLFRAAELVACVFVVAAAVASDPDRWLPRSARVLILFTGTSLVLVLLGALFAPSLALRPVNEYGSAATLLPFRLEGVMPHVTANTVGTYGVFLVLLTVYARDVGLVTPRASVTLYAIGLAGVILSQYRTGYAALVAAGLMYALFRRRYLLALTVGLTMVMVVVLAGPRSALTDALEGLLLRGQTPEMAASLTGRADFWAAALAVWGDSPVLGAGLSSATRFDVLAELGRGAVSTIHSTWVEALVGTGLAGSTLLISTVALTFAAALKKRQVFPTILLVALLVRSLTGTTIELMGYQAVLFALLMHWVTAPDSLEPSPSAEPRAAASQHARFRTPLPPPSRLGTSPA